MDREFLITLLTLAGTSGATVWLANANRRKIDREAQSVAAETDRIQDTRTRNALADAAEAERRAAKWSDAFHRLWSFLQRHFASYHGDESVELPNRDEFIDGEAE